VKQWQLLSADASALEAVNPESLCFRDKRAERHVLSKIRKVKPIRYKICNKGFNCKLTRGIENFGSSLFFVGNYNEFNEDLFEY
jgi:hypothetical protein